VTQTLKETGLLNGVLEPKSFKEEKKIESLEELFGEEYHNIMEPNIEAKKDQVEKEIPKKIEKEIPQKIEKEIQKKIEIEIPKKNEKRNSKKNTKKP